MQYSIVHWPGKDVVACEIHEFKLRNLASHMGFFLSTTPAPEGSACSNCENEAKKREVADAQPKR